MVTRIRDLDLDPQNRRPPVPTTDGYFADKPAVIVDEVRDGEATINQMVGKIAGELLERFKTLRARIDALEQKMVSSAAAAKGALEGHVQICLSVNEEINRLSTVIDKMVETHEDTTILKTNGGGDHG